MKLTIDFESLRRIRLPTRKERGLYHGWVKYLSDSRLTDDEIHRRASAYGAHDKIPKE